MVATALTFATEREAFDWLYEQADDPCVDNTRLDYEDDPLQWFAYERQLKEGCCGCLDYGVVIAGRKARIGCNYGH